MVVDENAKMTDCYFEKKDWRACAEEVSLRFRLLGPVSIPFVVVKQVHHDPTQIMEELVTLLFPDARLTVRQMEEFRRCWKQHDNDKRTDSKDA